MRLLIVRVIVPSRPSSAETLAACDRALDLRFLVYHSTLPAQAGQKSPTTSELLPKLHRAELKLLTRGFRFGCAKVDDNGMASPCACAISHNSSASCCGWCAASLRHRLICPLRRRFRPSPGATATGSRAPRQNACATAQRLTSTPDIHAVIAFPQRWHHAQRRATC